MAIKPRAVSVVAGEWNAAVGQLIVICTDAIGIGYLIRDANGWLTGILPQIRRCTDSRRARPAPLCSDTFKCRESTHRRPPSVVSSARRLHRPVASIGPSPVTGRQLSFASDSSSRADRPYIKHPLISLDCFLLLLSHLFFCLLLAVDLVVVVVCDAAQFHCWPEESIDGIHGIGDAAGRRQATPPAALRSPSHRLDARLLQLDVS